MDGSQTQCGSDYESKFVQTVGNFKHSDSWQFQAYVTHSHKAHRKSPEHFLRYRPINISQINRKQRNFQEKYWLFIEETLSEYDKWYIILELRISKFSTSTNLKNYFPTLTTGFVGVGHIYRQLTISSIYRQLVILSIHTRLLFRLLWLLNHHLVSNLLDCSSQSYVQPRFSEPSIGLTLIFESWLNRCWS